MMNEFDRVTNLPHGLFYKRWCYIGGGSQSAKMPPIPDPIPTVASLDIETQRKSEDIRKKLMARAGRAGTILTEGSLGMADISKQILLGGGTNA